MAPAAILCSTWAKPVEGREGLANGKDPEFGFKRSTILRSAGDYDTNREQLISGHANYFRQKWQKT
jgi:hypothetical protein